MDYLVVDQELNTLVVLCAEGVNVLSEIEACRTESQEIQRIYNHVILYLGERIADVADELHGSIESFTAVNEAT